MDNEIINREPCPICDGTGTIMSSSKDLPYLKRCGSCGGKGWYLRFGIMGTGAVWEALTTACAGRYRVVTVQ